MSQSTAIMGRLTSPIRQIWEDYKTGRAARRRKTKQQDTEPDNRKDTDKLDRTEDPPTSDEKQDENTTREPTKPPPPSSRPRREGWRFNRAAEFPWRLEQVVSEESNWRGTWVLEVKDLVAMDWATVRVPKEGGRGGKYERQPTKQLPFTPEMRQGKTPGSTAGGQDELMVMLGRK